MLPFLSSARSLLLPALVGIALGATAPSAMAQLAPTEIELAAPGGWRVFRTPIGVYRQAAGSSVQEATAWATGPQPAASRSLAIDPANPDWWLVGTADVGGPAQVVILTDDGTTLNASDLSLTGGAIRDLAFSPELTSTEVLATFDGGGASQAGIYRSTNSGKNFSPVPSTAGFALRFVEFDPFDPLRVIAMDAFGFQTRSFDGGQTWSPLAPGTPFLGQVRFLETSVHTPGRLYASESGAGFWRSDDFGSTWSSLGGTGVGEKAFVESPNVPDTLWVIDDLNRYSLSCDGGESFGTPNASFVGTLLRDLELDPATGSLLIGTDALGLSELTAPVVALGQAVQGSGGFRPGSTWVACSRPATRGSGSGGIGCSEDPWCTRR